MFLLNFTALDDETVLFEMQPSYLMVLLAITGWLHVAFSFLLLALFLTLEVRRCTAIRLVTPFNVCNSPQQHCFSKRKKYRAGFERWTTSGYKPSL